MAGGNVMAGGKSLLTRALISGRYCFVWSFLAIAGWRVFAGYAALPQYAWLQGFWWQAGAYVGLPLVLALYAVLLAEYARIAATNLAARIGGYLIIAILAVGIAVACDLGAVKSILFSVTFGLVGFGWVAAAPERLGRESEQ